MQKNVPSGIRCRDLNSQPLDFQSPLMTTKPGLTQDVTQVIFMTNSV